MSAIGLAEAAKLAGRNQSTIHRAMKTGRLAYTIGTNGERQIDTGELDRVFGIKVNGASADAMAFPMHRNVTHGAEIALLRQQLHDRDESIRDLRARLDASEAERRTVQVQLTALLADRTSPPATARRRWWWKAAGS